MRTPAPEDAKPPAASAHGALEERFKDGDERMSAIEAQIQNVLELVELSAETQAAGKHRGDAGHQGHRRYRQGAVQAGRVDRLVHPLGDAAGGRRRRRLGRGHGQEAFVGTP